VFLQPQLIIKAGNDGTNTNVFQIVTDYSAFNVAAHLAIPYGAICVDNDNNCTSLTSGQVRADSFPTSGGDLAENYPAFENMTKGDIVVLRADRAGVGLGRQPYTDSIVGVVSTNPGVILSSNNADNSKEYYSADIGLLGKVPTKVMLTIDSIKSGNYITTSPLAGIGMKSKQAGQTVGKALEDTTSWSASSCPVVSSINQINWPIDEDGSNATKPCFRIPYTLLDLATQKQITQSVGYPTDGYVYVGKILVLVSPSWYKPYEPHAITASTSGWYRISKLNGSDDYAKVKINNTTFGSSQNLILSVDTVGEAENVNIISNFTTGGYDISKARVNSVNGVKYLEIYLETVNGNSIKVDIDGDITNWIGIDITKVDDTLIVDNEFEFKGLLFAVSETLDVTENSVKVGGNLLTNSDTMNNIGDEVNRWNDIYTKGAIRLGSGVGKEGAIRFNVELQVLEFSNDGTTWVQLGDLNSQVVISPEYPGAILFADGTENFGSMTSDAEESTGMFRNYYEWVSDRETLQDYDILVRVTLPNDFVSWKEDAIYLDFMTENSASVNNNKVDMYLMGSSGIDAQVNDGISKLPGAWERISIKGLDISDCNNAGDTCTLRISLSSLQSYFVRVGDITLNYNRGL